jgi:hypothetical protein
MFGRTGAKIERGKGWIRYMSLALMGKMRILEEDKKSSLAWFYPFRVRYTPSPICKLQ